MLKGFFLYCKRAFAYSDISHSFKGHPQIKTCISDASLTSDFSYSDKYLLSKTTRRWMRMQGKPFYACSTESGRTVMQSKTILLLDAIDKHYRRRSINWTEQGLKVADFANRLGPTKKIWRREIAVFHQSKLFAITSLEASRSNAPPIKKIVTIIQPYRDLKHYRTI